MLPPPYYQQIITPYWIFRRIMNRRSQQSNLRFEGDFSRGRSYQSFRLGSMQPFQLT